MIDISCLIVTLSTFTQASTKSGRNRIVDSDSEDDHPPVKKFKMDGVSKRENYLNKDFDSEPTDLLDDFINALQSMFTDYDRMVGVSYNNVKLFVITLTY